MNLYVFCNKSRGTLYGVGTYIRELVAALRGSRIRVTVVSVMSEEPSIKREEIAGVTYWSFPEPVSEDWHPLDVRQWKVYARNIVYLLQRHIKDRTELIFHLNSSKDEPLARELKAAFDCKVVVAAHFSDWATALFDNLPRFRRILRDKDKDEWGDLVRESFEEERSCYAIADRVISLSTYMYDVLCRDYELRQSRISIIPNGMQDRAGQREALTTLRAKWHVGPEERLILFVGRLDPIKGTRYLIEAFHKVLGGIPESRLIIVGDGNYDKALDVSRPSCLRVTFTGFLNPDALYELYRLADVGVVPSLFEPFGYVPVEMMMHGLPIVATATSGLNEVVDESCGRKVPLSVSTDEVTIDTDLLAEQIVYLLRHPEEARRLGQNGRRRYLSEYTSERFGRRMLAFYESLS